MSPNPYDIYHCCVYSEKLLMMDGQRNCPKYVEFYSKNKFEKLVHVVGFVVRIYHDAPSPERQKEGLIRLINLNCSHLYEYSDTYYKRNREKDIRAHIKK